MKSLVFASALGAAVLSFADPVDGVWTGAEDGFFTNANNWAAGAVPGRYLGRDGDGNLVTNGVYGGKVTFGDDLTGNRVTTIDFDGVYSMTNLIVTATQTRYTLGTSANQFIPIESRGTFNGGATADALVPTIVAKLRVGVDCDSKGYGTDFHCFRNESTETLVLGTFGSITKRVSTGGNEFGLRTYGAGAICFTNGYTATTPHVFIYSTGTLYLDSTLGFRNITFANETSADNNKVRHVVIGEKGNLKNNAGFYAALINNGSVPLEISGEGVFTQGSGGNSSTNYDPHVKSGMFSCSAPMTISSAMALTESRPAGYESVVLGLWITGGNSPLTLNVPEGKSTVRGLFRFTSTSANAVLQLPRIGLRGTYGAHGDEDFSFCNNGILRYTGSGETMDRYIAITNQLAQNKAAGSTYTASGTLEQAGTGVWRVESPVSLTGPSSGTLTLKNATAVDAVYAGTMAGAVAVTKTGSGRWKIDSAAGYTGATTVSAGTLYITKNGSIAASSAVTVAGGAALVFEGDDTAFAQTCPAITVTGPNATIDVGSNCTLTLAGINMGSGSLDVRTADSTAVLKITGLSGDAPISLTLNGKPASFDSEGRLVKYFVPVTTTVPVHGGVIASDATAGVGIVDGGTEGNVTLAAAATVVKSVVQRASSDATVEIGAGRTLTAEAIAIDEGKANLAIGGEDDAGTLVAASGTFTLQPESSNSVITVNATPNLTAATGLAKQGEGTARFTRGFACGGTVGVAGGELAVTPAGTAPGFTLSGRGSFAKEGTGDWTVSNNSPAFEGDYIVRGGTVQPGALNATQLFGVSGDLVLTNGTTLKLFGGRDGTPDYGEKRLRAADSTVEIDVMHSAALSTKPFRRLKLDGDLTVTGTVAGDSKDTYLVGLKNSVRGEADLGGHTITKTGYGRFGFDNVDIVSGGEIVLPETPGFNACGAGNILMLAGVITAPANDPVRVITSNGVTVCLSSTAPVPFDWTIGSGTSYLGTWISGRPPLTTSNWGGTINLTSADSQLSLYTYGDAGRAIVVSGKITGLGSVTNYTRIGRYFFSSPTNDYQGYTTFEFPNGSGSYGAAGFARFTTLPNFSRARFRYYGAACLRISGDGGEGTSWPLTEVGRLMREATFQNDAYAGLDLADTGDFEMNISDLGTPPAADKVSGFGRYGYYPDTHVLTVNLDEDWSAAKLLLGCNTGTMRIQGAGHPLTVDYLRVSGEGSTSTGVVEIVGGAEVRANRATAALCDYSLATIRVGDGGTLCGPTGPGSTCSPITLANCTYSRGLLELLPGGSVTGNITIGAGANSYGGAVYQTGGAFTSGANVTYLGSYANGYWLLEGGTADFVGAGRMYMSVATNVTSLLKISGGRMTFSGTQAPAIIGPQKMNHGHILMTGGELLFRGTTAGRAMEWPYSAASAFDSTGVITLDGATALLSVTNTQNIFLANQTNGLAIVNLNAGTLEAGSIQACKTGYPGSEAYLNFNGGTLKACMSTSDWVTGVTRAEVGPGGAVFDTAGHDATFKPSLVAPAGQGVAGVEWSYAKPVDLPYFVRIVGDGSGASAVVEYNRATKMMTGIRILSAGSGYTWAKAYITSGQSTIYSFGYHTEVDCTLGAAAAAGGLVKKGAGKLTLTGTANAWGGDTVIEDGLLEIGADGALPAGAHLVLKGGGVTAAAGVTMPAEMDVAISAAQLANEKARYVLASYPNGLPAMLPTFNWTDQVPTGAWQVCRDGNELVLRRVKGTMFIFR